MIGIESYFVFIIYVMGVIDATPVFSIIDYEDFYDFILHEHNEYRKLHHASPLTFNLLPQSKAHKYLASWVEDTSETPNNWSVNHFSMKLNEDSKLDAELAKNIVATWYKNRENYNYDLEPKSKPTDADPFTRIVWQFATELGVGSKVKDNTLYVVAYYFDIDLNEQNYKDNVKKP